MSFLPFNAPLPIDYFADGGRLTTRSSGPVQDRRDSLVDFLNDLREKVVFSGYRVDPDDDSKFDTIDDAYAAAHAELPAGYPIEIIVALGKVYNTTLTVDKSRHVSIRAESLNQDPAAPGSVTEINGTVTVPNASDQELRRTLTFTNLSVNGTINGNAYWAIVFNTCVLACTVNRTHTTGVPEGGCFVYVNSCSNNGAAFKIIDTDAAFFNLLAGIIISNSKLIQSSAGTTITAAGPILVRVYNSILETDSAGDTFVDFASNANGKIEFRGFIISCNDDTTLLKNIGATTTVEWDEFKAVMQSGKVLTMGQVATNKGCPTVFADTEPITIPVGTIWCDEELKDKLMWDGTYWGNGSIFRKNLLVDVDTAAVSHSSGWTVPAGAGVINVSANALKDLTGGGGATLYGISDGSDGDKFAESSALTQNSKASAKQASINVGGGDTIYVHSMTSSGTEGGTLAGSNDEDVRIVVYFTMPKTLPSV
jgi:hypothetical protein